MSLKTLLVALYIHKDPTLLPSYPARRRKLHTARPAPVTAGTGGLHTCINSLLNQQGYKQCVKRISSRSLPFTTYLMFSLSILSRILSFWTAPTPLGLVDSFVVFFSLPQSKHLIREPGLSLFCALVTPAPRRVPAADGPLIFAEQMKELTNTWIGWSPGPGQALRPSPSPSWFIFCSHIHSHRVLPSTERPSGAWKHRSLEVSLLLLIRQIS